jgi:hypothetical protein
VSRKLRRLPQAAPHTSAIPSAPHASAAPSALGSLPFPRVGNGQLDEASTLHSAASETPKLSAEACFTLWTSQVRPRPRRSHSSNSSSSIPHHRHHRHTHQPATSSRWVSDGTLRRRIQPQATVLACIVLHERARGGGQACRHLECLPGHAWHALRLATSLPHSIAHSLHHPPLPPHTTRVALNPRRRC